MKKSVKIVDLLLFALVLTLAVVLVHATLQTELVKTVNSVAIDGTAFDPSTQTFVYVPSAKAAKQELEQKLYPKGATINDVEIGPHSLRVIVHWPLLGTYRYAVQFVAKNVETGKVVYPPNP